MLDAEVVKLIRQLASRGHGIKEIAREVGVARKAVRRYLRRPVEAGFQRRPTRQAITARWRIEFETLYAACRGKPADIYRGLTAQGLRVSLRTIERRVVDQRQDASCKWELDLVQAIARRVRTTDHDELESALTDHLAKLRLRKHTASNWKAYLISGLARKAKNWLRDRATEAERVMSSDALDDLARQHGDKLESAVEQMDTAAEDGLAVAALRRQLTHGDRKILDALVAKNFNISRAAVRLGMHRNTFAKKLARIIREQRQRQL